MDALLDEVESLEAILMEDVKITRNKSNVPEIIETTIFPLLDEESDQQYVCVTLQVLPGAGYPEVSPDFKLVKPRGLDDGRLNAIKSACQQKLQQSLGAPVVFDLIEVVRELLSDSNLPSGQCVICLYGFSSGDDFTKTECFHYLHSYCLARHLNALRRNYQEEYQNLPSWQQLTAEPFRASCPVCREPISDDDGSLKCALPPAELQNAPDFQLTQELKQLQRKMATLFLQQKSRGAIIDVDASNNGAAVLSIETEEELRRRLQRKQRAEQQAAERKAQLTSANASGGSSSAAQAQPQPPQRTEQRAAAAETSNNTAAHNRRHYRGGRRHQHHHHRDRSERERERHEQHISSSHSNTAAANANATAAAAATNNGPSSSGGRHAKQASSSGSHVR